MGGTITGSELEGLLKSLGHQLRPEAVLDAAHDAGLLTDARSEDRNKRASAMLFSELSLDLDLSDLWRLLGSIRRREGLTHAEMIELKEVFNSHKTDSTDARGVDEILVLQAGKAIRWFG